MAKKGEILTTTIKDKSRQKTGTIKTGRDQPDYNLSYAEIIVPVFRTFLKQEQKIHAQEKLLHAYLVEIEELKQNR